MCPITLPSRLTSPRPHKHVSYRNIVQRKTLPQGAGWGGAAQGRRTCRRRCPAASRLAHTRAVRVGDARPARRTACAATTGAPVGPSSAGSAAAVFWNSCAPAARKRQGIVGSAWASRPAATSGAGGKAGREQVRCQWQPSHSASPSYSTVNTARGMLAKQLLFFCFRLGPPGYSMLMAQQACTQPDPSQLQSPQHVV